MNHYSIIIPTLNETDNIIPLLNEISEISTVHDLLPEVIFVDDGSTDGTRKKIEEYHSHLQVILIKRDTEKGLASAVVTGAQHASHEFMVVMDADLSHSPQAIPALLAPLYTGTHDMVIGSRYVEGGATPGLAFCRTLASRIATLPAALYTCVQDPLSGFFATKRCNILRASQKVAGFKIGLEILAAGGKKLRVHEVPITFKDRHQGYSKMTCTVLYQYLGQLWRLFRQSSVHQQLGFRLKLMILAGLIDATLFTTLNNHGTFLETAHMVSFFVALHACYFSSLPSKKKLGHALQPAKDYPLFLLIATCLLFIRGGILGQPVFSETSTSGLMAAILISTSAFSWGVTHTLLQRQHLSLKSGRELAFFSFLLIIYSVALRFVYIGSTELIQEEAYYWNYAQHLAAGYLDHPPVVALLIKSTTILFGDNEFGVRAGAFLCWFITAFFTYKLTTSIFDHRTGIQAILLTATLPIFFGVALVITPDAPLISCWAGTLYFLYRALLVDKPKAWYGVGICLGIGLCSKYTIVFLAPAIVLYLLLEPTARKWLFRPHPYIAALLASVLFTPVILWNYQNDWASFLFQSHHRLQASSEFSAHELLASILVLLTPTGLAAAVVSLKIGNRPRKRGVTGDPVKAEATTLFTLLMVLVPLAIFFLFSLTKEIKLNWTGPIWLMTIPFMAYTMSHANTRLQKRVVSMWPGTLLFLVLSYGAILHYCALGLPGIPFANKDFLFGWEDLARQVESEVEKIAEDRGQRPLVVGLDKYRLASGLSFYRMKQKKHYDASLLEETTGSHLLGRNSLMYSYWFSPIKAANKDLLVIADKKSALHASKLHGFSDDYGKIREIAIEKQGKKAGRYYSRLLTWYNPVPQKKKSPSPIITTASWHQTKMTSIEENTSAP